MLFNVYFYNYFNHETFLVSLLFNRGHFLNPRRVLLDRYIYFFVINYYLIKDKFEFSVKI